MFLHLGSEIAVPKKEIIGIFDIQSTSKAKGNQQLLKAYLEAGYIPKSIMGEPRSFVITESRKRVSKTNKVIKENRLYYSLISALTLQKRAGFIDEIEKF